MILSVSSLQRRGLRVSSLVTAFSLFVGVQGTLGFAQSQARPAASVPAAATDTGCCGPITPKGAYLLHVLDGMDVDHLWLSKHQVEWRTGAPKHHHGGTHCSAFAAAVADRLGIYMLRPPQHSQDFLASAQGHWFDGEHAHRDGWRPVNSPQEAQARANRGELVVLVYPNPTPHEHGHIAIVRPAIKSEQALAAEGPETIQAGLHNFSDGTAVHSFHSHKGAWPNQVRMYAHVVQDKEADSSVQPGR